ncbi:hypothetical protein L0Y34_01000 [Candidatus Parcubacteria bacterium]|nr:hypothetical protein [Candidatus Parcubacteria bacterium]
MHEGLRQETTKNKKETKQRPNIFDKIHAAVLYARAAAEEGKAKREEKKHRHGEQATDLALESQHRLYGGYRGRNDTGQLLGMRPEAIEDFIGSNMEEEILGRRGVREHLKTKDRERLLIAAIFLEAKRNLDVNVDALVEEVARSDNGGVDHALGEFIHALKILEQGNKGLKEAHPFTETDEDGSTKEVRLTLKDIAEEVRNIYSEAHASLISSMREITRKDIPPKEQLKKTLVALEAYKEKAIKASDLLRFVKSVLEREYRDLLNTAPYVSFERVPSSGVHPRIVRHQTEGINLEKLTNAVNDARAPLLDYLAAAQDATLGYAAFEQGREHRAIRHGEQRRARRLRRKARRVLAGRSAVPRQVKQTAESKQRSKRGT